MKITRLSLLLAVAAGTLSCTAYVEAPPPPRAVAEVDVDVDATATIAAGPASVEVFYDELAPYGRWVEVSSYGRVFVPAGVGEGWRPYVAGRWVNSEFGWTWVSQERWGWATYHYGRWYPDPAFGWVWVPGTVWGPAWVSFHQGGGYIGWAPLPPAVGFRAGVGLQLGGVELSASISTAHYAFVPERNFLAPAVATYVVPPARNVTIINNTTNITNITVVNNRVVNNSVNVQHVEQVTGQKVQVYKIAPSRAQGAARIQGNEVALYQPPAIAKAAAAQNGQGGQGGRGGRGRSQQPGAGAQAGTQAGAQAGVQAGAQAGGASSGEAARSSAGGASSTAADGHARATGRAEAAARPSSHQDAGSGMPADGNAQENAADLARRHKAERDALAAKHAEEKAKLDETHKRERANASAGAAGQGGQGGDNSARTNAAAIARKHQAEVKALQEQHQKEQAALNARHQQEREAAAKQKKQQKKDQKQQ
jgi:hypothetical protein